MTLERNEQIVNNGMEGDQRMSFFYCVQFFVMFFFSHTVLSAADRFSVIVVDGNTGQVLYGINETAQRYPASLAKKMTLYMIFEALKNKKIALSTKFKVSERAQSQGPSKMGVRAGEYVSVEFIIKSLVVKSANDLAVVAAEGLAGSVENFAQKMTEKAKQLGMQQTIFKNPSGVNDQCTTDRRQVTTAKDMSILGISLYRDFPEYTSYFKLQYFTHNGKKIHNHNHMLGEIEGLDGIKTGFVNASGFNISTSTLRYDRLNKPHRLFVVVMGGKSWRSRDRQAEHYIELGFKKVGCPSVFNQPQDSVRQHIATQNLQAIEVSDSTQTHNEPKTLKSVLNQQFSPLKPGLSIKSRLSKEKRRYKSGLKFSKIKYSKQKKSQRTLKNLLEKKSK